MCMGHQQVWDVLARGLALKGDVAQMEERVLRMHEAQGSIPCFSKAFGFLGKTNHSLKQFSLAGERLQSQTDHARKRVQRTPSTHQVCRTTVVRYKEKKKNTNKTKQNKKQKQKTKNKPKTTKQMQKCSLWGSNPRSYEHAP